MKVLYDGKTLDAVFIMADYAYDNFMKSDYKNAFRIVSLSNIVIIDGVTLKNRYGPHESIDVDITKLRIGV